MGAVLGRRAPGGAVACGVFPPKHTPRADRAASAIPPRTARGIANISLRTHALCGSSTRDESLALLTSPTEAAD